jgi:hypothetical protein
MISTKFEKAIEIMQCGIFSFTGRSRDAFGYKQGVIGPPARTSTFLHQLVREN